jgi:hypothetical protein
MDENETDICKKGKTDHTERRKIVRRTERILGWMKMKEKLQKE